MRNAYLTTLGVLAAVLTVAALATLVLPGLAGSVTADSDNDGQQFEARLRGSEEVPPVSTNTRGSANLEFNEAETRLSFELEVEDGLRVTQAHIHCAAAGSNGPIVLFLGGLHDRGLNVDGDWIGDATATNESITRTDTPCGATLADFADAMANGLMYVNVHTVANGGGEVRGQIDEDGNGNGGDEDD
jgi:hypothetical protein